MVPEARDGSIRRIVKVEKKLVDANVEVVVYKRACLLDRGSYARRDANLVKHRF
jgi:hypothetical protein